MRGNRAAGTSDPTHPRVARATSARRGEVKGADCGRFGDAPYAAAAAGGKPQGQRLRPEECRHCPSLSAL